MGENRFSERTEEVLLEAKKESVNLKHGYIGTEHILLGILKEDGYAKGILEKNGIDYSKVNKTIEKYLGKGEVMIPKTELLFTPRAKALFEEALRESKKLFHKKINPEHLLMAILNETDGVAYTMISFMRVDLEQLKKDLQMFLEGQEVEEEDERIEDEQEDKMPMLVKYSTNLTKLARKRKLDPVIGRVKENTRVLEILCRRIKNNPCLIGEPGVGKTAVVEGLAQRIVEGNIPDSLKGKQIYSLDLTSLIAGAKYRGEFEDRLKKVMAEIKENKNIIIFIDEIHSIIGAGGAEGAIDASNILKPSLARGDIQCIGATTIEEYRKHIEKDSALERRFQPVLIDEPTNEQTLEILKGLKEKYEEHHNVEITDEALKVAVQMSDRYVCDRFMPDKAIDLIDEASAKVRIETLVEPPTLKNLEDDILKIKGEKDKCISIQEFEKAAKLRDRERELRKELEEISTTWSNKTVDKKLIVDRENIAKVVASWTNIPVEKLTEEESSKLLNLEENLHKRVIGQNEAINLVSKAVRRARVGLKNPNRPIGSFIFLGPTGVGKTELSKALAEAMFSHEDNMIRIDMSEYMEKHAVSKLIGAPPGYVGYDEGGQLTEAVRRKPYSVVLLDEIEKAHPDVFNILLQILEDGRLTDGKGKVVNFKNTIVIMTSNVGAHNIKKQKSVGFFSEEGSNKEYDAMKESILEELKVTFKPEFLNRIDDTIVFHKLTKNHMLSITEIMLKEVKTRLDENDIYIEFSDESKNYIIGKCDVKEFGARPLRRVITKEIEDKISEELLRGKIKKLEGYEATIKEDTLVFQ
ncbi:MAG: ATP-dependent Clp protease ATP-binding subunit [Clostridium sp.]|uniref:ATP-dependent Clp protease ATP-binding subunit n=1 Tax=Clostridium sp. TaxID=1506 RepID=UPI003F341536